MDTLQATYRDEEDDTTTSPSSPSTNIPLDGGATPADLISGNTPEFPEIKGETEDADQTEQKTSNRPPDGNEEPGEGEEDEPASKKQKQLPNSPKPEPAQLEITEMPSPADAITPTPQNGKPPPAKSGSKTKKKKSKDVWTTTSRKGKKKTKHASNNNHNSKNGANGVASTEDKVFITPIPRFPDKSDDSPDLNICLSKVYKAEKVELSEDRLTAGSTKGYRMVRATRGVIEGAWYFEIKVEHLGETGHTRLGWSTEKGDLQAPVGYDSNSYGYRDGDGSKVHKALREKYGDEGYKEGDVIGFYINLPGGGSYAPDPPRLVWHKGQRYVCAPNAKEDSPKVVPGKCYIALFLHHFVLTRIVGLFEFNCCVYI